MNPRHTTRWAHRGTPCAKTAALAERVQLRLVAGLLLAVGLLLAGRDAAACAGCSNPNLPTARSTTRALQAGQWQLGLNLSGTRLRVVHESRCPDIGPICTVRDEAPHLHDQTLWVGEVRAIAEVGLLPHWGLQLQLPAKVVGTWITYRRLDGSAFVPDYPTIHHRDETLAGIGDPWLQLRTATTAGRWLLVARTGVSIPLGGTVADPFALGRAGQVHQHIQFGTGTWNPLAAIELATAEGRASLAAYAQVQWVPYANSHGFRAGNRLGAGLSGGWQWSPALRCALAGDVVHEQAERWGGVIQQDGNLGRTDVLAGGQCTLTATGGQWTLAARTPVWQRIIGGQMTYPLIVTLGIETSP